MNKFFYNNRKFLIAFLSIFCALFLLLLPFLSSEIARAEQPSNIPSLNSKYFAPTSETMVLDVTTPIDAISFGNNIAVIKGETNSSSKTLLISRGGQPFVSCQLDNPGQLKALNDNVLIVSKGTILYMIDCSEDNLQPVQFKFNDQPIDCQSFDLNRNYLVTSSYGVITLYKINDNGVLQTPNVLGGTAENLTPISVNSLGTVFYIKKSTSTIHAYITYPDYTYSDVPLYTASGKISHMIAKDEKLFVIEGNKVLSLTQNIANQSANELTTSIDQNNQLGNLLSPVSLSFKGENLLISDSSINAVQEFSVENNSLISTGFAIAKNKTAYNRWTDTVCDLERTNDNLAILASDRVTLINLKDFDYLNKDAYLPLYKSSFDGKVPEDIAVGNSSLLTTSNDGDTIYIFNFDFKNPNAGTPVKLEHGLDIDHIHDCCYQSGYYYVLYSVDNKLHVYKINEISQETETFEYGNMKANPVFTVDVFGKYHVYSKDDGYLKLDSDLTGSVFAIKNDGFYKLIDEVFVKQYSAPSGISLESFTLDFDKKDVYYIAEGSEFIYKATEIGNKAINGTQAPSDYKITDTNAIEGLTAYLVNDSANVYSISEIDKEFSFNKLTESEEYYLFVCELTDINHKVLIGQKGLVLVHNDNLQDKPIDTVEVNKTKFISTSVCAYYFPIIDESSSLALINEGESATVRLSKGQEITAISSVEILGNSFYFACFYQDGVEIKGYIPVDFTVDELTVDVEWINFTIEATKGVDVFSDVELKNKVATLEKGTSVRLYSAKDGVCKIAYFDGQNWIDAYVTEDSIEQKPNTTIRNLLIILALTACVCGTITFFVIRKKED